jgi:hypothetical protein
LSHTRSDDLQASAFKTAVDLADNVFSDCVWFDDRQGAFDCHLKNSNKKKGLKQKLMNQSTLDFTIEPHPQSIFPAPLLV